ncbi:4Fe-4S dicluster domain-containing protein [Candidatus Thorarchaeota archaeon]|nr:MAG: 4Fe-4S dicluster domain-containing protein [Candidatus Thorarchaeota archaeon]
MEGELHHPSSDFAKELEKVPGGEAIKKCVQCGICTATCMVARESDKYRPRQLIQKILLGEREEVLKSLQPWLCMSCMMCEERCQEGVSPSDIFHAVRRIAAKEGHVPSAYKQTVETVLKDGWLLEDSYSDFIEDDRDDLGLEMNLKWNKKFVEHVKKKYFPEVEE